MVKFSLAGALAIAALTLQPNPALGAGGQGAGSSVDTVAVHDGLNRISLSVTQVFGTRPPAILFQPLPARVNCRVLGYGYNANESSPTARTATLRMRLRCRDATARAYVRLEFRPPLERIFAPRDGKGSVDVALHTPSRVRPLIAIGIKPAGPGECTERGASLTPQGRAVDLRVSGRCTKLPRGAEAVVSIGGLLLTRSAANIAPLSRSSSPAASAALFRLVTDKDGPIKCKGQGNLHCTQIFEMWWGRIYTQEYGQPCATGWHYSPTPDWPGWTVKRIPDVGPTEMGNFLGVFTFTMWGVIDPPLKVEFGWTCKLGSPVNLAPPTIKGEAVAGRTLTCDPGRWAGDPTFFGFQWLDGATPIAGATGLRYTPPGDRRLARLACRVTVANAATAANNAKPGVATSAATEPVVVGPPVTRGDVKIQLLDILGGEVIRDVLPGQRFRVKTYLKCVSPSWIDARSVGYQWLRNAHPIGGAADQRYRLESADQDAKISCRVTAVNQAGSTVKTSYETGPTEARGGQIL